MKTLTKFVIGIILAFIVATFVWALFFGRAGAPTINKVVSSGVPADWVTYTDPNDYLSIKAPADFKVTQGHIMFSQQSPLRLIVPTTTPYFHTHLTDEVYVQVDWDDVACYEASNQNGIIATTSVQIDGVIFERRTTSDVGAGQLYQGVDYMTTKNGVCYNVFLFTHSTNGEGFYTDNAAQIARVDAQQKADITALFKLFDQVAGTIKFTK